MIATQIPGLDEVLSMSALPFEWWCMPVAARQWGQDRQRYHMGPDSDSRWFVAPRWPDLFQPRGSIENLAAQCFSPQLLNLPAIVAMWLASPNGMKATILEASVHGVMQMPINRMRKRQNGNGQVSSLDAQTALERLPSWRFLPDGSFPKVSDLWFAIGRDD